MAAEETWIRASSLEEGDAFDDDGRRRVASSIVTTPDDIKVECEDGALRIFRPSTPIKLWDPSSSQRQSDLVPRPSTSRSQRPTSSKSPKQIDAPMPQTDQGTTPRVQTPDTTLSSNDNALLNLATISLVAEVILWGLLGVSLVAALLLGLHHESEVCPWGFKSRAECTPAGHPFIKQAIALAVVSTGFYLFGITIMRAIRVWAQRFIMGLPA